ncbi:MAG: alcohol dehydrogenase [Thermoprotei archaeon]|nr:MAG: alcohol dehydrogenase [Thermoprotei archaeon]
MKAMVLEEQKPIKEKPLKLKDVPKPVPREKQVLIRIRACGICRTDLHIVEGELPPVKLPLIPGHQVVGVVEETGEHVGSLRRGDRVGVAWLYWTCGSCEFCRRGLENLCERALFTGYSVDGGYAEYIAVPEEYAFPLPGGYSDEEVAPLLCGGVIGYRAFKLAELPEEGVLGLFGFGSAAHIVLQIAKYFGHKVYVFTRSPERQELARRLGAEWAGHPKEESPVKLDSAIVFAPAGWVAVEALKNLKKGGRLVLAEIYMTPIEHLEYRLLYYERSIKTVANFTRKDAVELLSVAPKAGVKTSVEVFKLSEANEALLKLKTRGLRASGVLKVV